MNTKTPLSPIRWRIKWRDSITGKIGLCVLPYSSAESAQTEIENLAIKARESGKLIEYVAVPQLSPSERGKLGGKPKGGNGRQLTTEQARATVAVRWQKYRKNHKKGVKS